MVGDVSTNIIGFIENWKIYKFVKEEKVPVTLEGPDKIPIKFEVLYPVSKPALPYMGKIPLEIKHNMALFMHGTVRTDAKSFDINFYTGSLDGDDIAFHFKPRIGQYTALNSFRSGQWETEESAPIKPFTAGAPFFMFVVITPNGYEVYVNGEKHCTFNHRISFEKWSRIQLCGDVSINIFGFIQNFKLLAFFKESKTTLTIMSTDKTSIQFEVSYPVSKPALPYVGKIPVGIKPHMALFFQGTLQTDAKSFDINLYTGPADGDDIAFHFNPRIGQYTTLNSFRNGQWETEESAPIKPFTAGAQFFMFFVITPNGYEVYVNSQKHCTFNHRIPFEKLSTIRICGNISISIIGFIENWKTSPLFK
ncbi:galectin-6-like [Trichomycterus rosablanca]|uniref:galectin-6-like n=1 Tax=Trichomycterus rosablanca TaxID=2290929 RepID=UPI002F354436